MKRSYAFTLLEVMVAIAILAMSMTAIIGLTGSSMMKSARAEKLAVATMLARQKMTEVEIELQKGMAKGEFPEDKSEDGKFDDPFEDYTWKFELKKVELPAPVTGEEGSVQDLVGKEMTREISKTVREVKLTVFWKERGQEQTLDVVTHLVKL